jgi:hypothetical protein
MEKILCRSCAAYGGCKLLKKGTATKCRNFWEHRSTEDFIKAIEKRDKKNEI